MHSLGIAFILVILASISFENYGFPHNTLTPSTTADVIEVSTNQDASVGLVGTSATHPASSTSDDDDDDATSVQGLLNGDIIDQASTNAVNGVDDVGRAVADLSQGTDHQDDTRSNNTSAAQVGFPWWSLMLILLSTIVIIIAIALPFVLYNRRLNRRRAVIKSSKRASEVIVDSWMAASQSSIPGGSPSVSSDSGNEYDVETTCNHSKLGPQSNWGMVSIGNGNSQENILGAEGGC